MVMGCGDDGLGKRYPVYGTVTYKDRPARDGNRYLLCHRQRCRDPCATGSIKDGSYSMSTIGGEDGAFPGDYQVSISSRNADMSEAKANQEKTGGSFRQDDVAKAYKAADSVIPKKYDSTESPASRPRSKPAATRSISSSPTDRLQRPQPLPSVLTVRLRVTEELSRKSNLHEGEDLSRSGLSRLLELRPFRRTLEISREPGCLAIASPSDCRACSCLVWVRSGRSGHDSGREVRGQKEGEERPTAVVRSTPATAQDYLRQSPGARAVSQGREANDFGLGESHVSRLLPYPRPCLEGHENALRPLALRRQGRLVVGIAPASDAVSRLARIASRSEAAAHVRGAAVHGRRYDFSGKTIPGVLMSGGRKGIPAGPVARSPRAG